MKVARRLGRAGGTSQPAWAMAGVPYAWVCVSWWWWGTGLVVMEGRAGADVDCALSSSLLCEEPLLLKSQVCGWPATMTEAHDKQRCAGRRCG